MDGLLFWLIFFDIHGNTASKFWSRVRSRTYHCDSLVGNNMKENHWSWFQCFIIDQPTGSCTPSLALKSVTMFCHHELYGSRIFFHKDEGMINVRNHLQTYIKIWYLKYAWSSNCHNAQPSWTILKQLLIDFPSFFEGFAACQLWSWLQSDESGEEHASKCCRKHVARSMGKRWSIEASCNIARLIPSLDPARDGSFCS